MTEITNLTSAMAAEFFPCRVRISLVERRYVRLSGRRHSVVTLGIAKSRRHIMGVQATGDLFSMGGEIFRGALPPGRLGESLRSCFIDAHSRPLAGHEIPCIPLL